MTIVWFLPSFLDVKTDQYSRPIFSEQDLFDLAMQGTSLFELDRVITDSDLDLSATLALLDDPGQLVTWQRADQAQITVAEFDRQQQSHWHMPDSYRHTDIAAHVLSLCDNDVELQRCGQELLLFQQANLFDLLRYLRYLVDVMTTNHVIWGVGRGSSVASFVLYKLGVHRINSLYYDLDPHEFLR